jgi:hypothetical protein
MTNEKIVYGAFVAICGCHDVVVTGTLREIVSLVRECWVMYLGLGWGWTEVGKIRNMSRGRQPVIGGPESSIQI